MVDGGDGNACVALSTVGLSVTTEASAAASSSSRSENGWSSSSFAAMPRRGRWMRIRASVVAISAGAVCRNSR